MLCLRHGGLATFCERSEIVLLKKMNENYVMEKKNLGPGETEP